MPKPIDYADSKLTRTSKKPRRKTGPAGRVVILPCQDFIADLRPETSVEREYAQTIADGHWRLRQGDFDANHPSIHAAYRVRVRCTCAFRRGFRFANAWPRLKAQVHPARA